MKETSDKRIAVLIDTENIAAKNIDAILDKASLEGIATIKRIYGDFSSESKAPQAKAWNKEVAEHALMQVQQLQNSKGKNSSDSALIIDAMDLMYSGHVDAFCLVSNDSDFTRLANRIRESGIDVIGIGTAPGVSSKSFVNACTKFYFLSDAKESAPPAQEKRKQKEEKARVPEKGAAAAATNHKGTKPLPVPKNVTDTIIAAIENADMDSDDWANISQVGSVLRRRFPEFDPSHWNRPKQMSAFLKSISEFEVAAAEDIGKPSGSYIRIRT
jgi:uncharacterized protein (TIGR00288 family)